MWQCWWAPHQRWFRFFFRWDVHAVLPKLLCWSQDGTVGSCSHTPGVSSLLSTQSTKRCGAWEGLAQPPQRCWSFAGTEFVYLCITFLSSVYSRGGDIGTLQLVLNRATPGLENLVPWQCKGASVARPEHGLEVAWSVQTCFWCPWHGYHSLDKCLAIVVI